MSTGHIFEIDSRAKCQLLSRAVAYSTGSRDCEKSCTVNRRLAGEAVGGNDVLSRMRNGRTNPGAAVSQIAATIMNGTNAPMRADGDPSPAHGTVDFTGS